MNGRVYELLPFGSGRRMCPAYNFGLRVVQIAPENLIHGFQWELPYGQSPKDLAKLACLPISITLIPRTLEMGLVTLPSHKESLII